MHEILVHESGHSLGFAHALSGNSIMRPLYDHASQLCVPQVDGRRDGELPVAMRKPDMHSRILISIALLAVFTIAFVYCTNEQPPKTGVPDTSRR